MAMTLRIETCVIPVFLLLCLHHTCASTFCGNVTTTQKPCRFKRTSVGVKVSCSNLHLTSVPRDLPNDTISLDLSYNNLTWIKNDDFRGLAVLEVLNLDSNNISMIQGESFWPLTSLRVLILNRNRLKSLAPDLFLHNVLLDNVGMTVNLFVEIPHKALSALTSLPILYLRSNLITALNFKGFDRFKFLSRISLENNHIASVKQSDFLPLQNVTVKSVVFTSNYIHSLPPRVFCFLEEADSLRLGGNAITTFDIQPFLGMKSIDTLDLEGSLIRQLLPSNKSSNISMPFPTILNLILKGNLITNVPRGAFWGYEMLQTLIISVNKITAITNDSFCELMSLTELDMSQNTISFVPDQAFSCLHNLRRLNASGNMLMTLSADFFHGMPSIETIVLSHNLIAHILEATWDIPTLQTLDISHNLLKYLRKNTFYGLSNLQILNISFNKLQQANSPDCFVSLINLRKLYFLSEQRTYLNGFLKHLTELQFLDLSNAYTTWESMDQFTQNPHLNEIRMEQTQIKGSELYDKIQNVSLFSGLASLGKLRIKGNYLYDMDANVFSNLSGLYYLDISDSRIPYLPLGIFKDLSYLQYLFINDNNLIALDGQLFRGVGNLRILYIQSNALSRISKETFESTPNLQKLFLPENHINTILPDTFFPTVFTLSLDISRNPLSCTCSLQWFRNWLQDANIRLKHPSQTVCSSASLAKLPNKPLLSFNPSDFCGVDFALISGLSFAGVVVVLSGILAYINRWWINYKLFLLKLAIFGYNEIEEDVAGEDYDYQLNLMFHDADEQMVNGVIRPALQEHMPHLRRIIYGDDDLNAGMFYVDAIYHAIESSHKTVLLLSNRSVVDPWFMTKLRMALEHLNETRLDKVVLIFVEAIEDDILPYLVRLFLSRNRPYMLWTEDEDGQELFWATFEKSMRTNRVLNNVIPV